MKNKIDDLLKENLDEFTSSPTPQVRAKISARIRYFNFLKFNPGSFNIFYLGAIVLGISATIVFSNEPQKVKNTEEKVPTIKNTDSIIEEKNIITNEDTVINVFMSDQQHKNHVYEETENSEFIKNETIEQMTETSDNEHETENSVIAVEKNDTIIPEAIEKNFIFDTIITPEIITITDTVKTEVHKTVEVKKKRNKK